MRQRLGVLDHMSHHTRKKFEDEISAWLVIGAIFGAVALGLWGMLIWQSLHD